MSLKHIWGFGGVYLTCPGLGLTCDLSTTPGSMEFEPISLKYTTLDQEQHIVNMGYRMKASFEAYNVCDGDYSDFANLLAILNASAYQGRDIYLYPHYSTTDDNLSYLVKCISNINFENIAPSKAGQRIKLDFESVYPVDQLPTLMSDPVSYDWIDHNGNTIIDHDGNILQLVVNT